MPAKLIAYVRHLQDVQSQKGADGTRIDATEHLSKVCALVRGATGHDFSHYKEKTLVRRIQRRMQVLQLDSMPAYIENLRKDPREVDLLFRDLLIGVTHFFRDPAAFETLESKVIGPLLQGMTAEDTVRVWVPACATGQEAYSIAILLREAAEKFGVHPSFQLFATDIDERAIKIARAARYTRAALGDMLESRRSRWFSKEGDLLCPVKEIREMCIFSTHSVIKDPPFSRLDLISCRNVMIYLDTTLQDRLLRTFHYALKPGGGLFLGTSENVTRHHKLFAALDQKQRLFQRRDAIATPPSTTAGIGGEYPPARAATPLAENGLEKAARRLVEKHIPPYVVIDANHDVLRFSGATEKYLGPSPGAASLNFFNLIRRSLRPAARAAISKALASGGLVVHEAIPLEVNGVQQFVDLVAESIPDLTEGLCVVTFVDRKAPVGAEVLPRARQARTEAMERELRSTRERLEATVEQMETSNEEMKSANEEYQSVNEELQSTNEELETSKEEMQSINEELQTVNAELNSKSDTLLRLNSDLRNLLDSTQIATLFLDRQLRIKGYTPPMTDLFHLRDTDQGRPLTDIVTSLSYDELAKDAVRVLRDLSVIEREVSVKGDGPTFQMRMRPYRTIDNVIDGVVVTFVDITERRHAEDLRSHLIDELNHRVKNTLARVQAIVALSLRGVADRKSLEILERRLVALSQTHNLLARQSWARISLSDLLSQETAPYRTDNDTRFTIQGPDLELTPDAGLALGLAFHELVTNAAKYGALSSQDGHVSVTWSIEKSRQSPILRLKWQETDGPKVKNPETTGFGSIVIKRGLEYELEGKVDSVFDADGLVVTVELSLSNIAAAFKPRDENA
jgi:two-component system CheB/CheR fusion protein